MIWDETGQYAMARHATAFYGICVMAWHGAVGNMAWYGMAWYGMVWYGMVWDGMGRYGMVWYGLAWCGMVWCDMVWCDTRGGCLSPLVCC